MKKNQSRQVLRIMLLTGTIVSMFFVPWILLRALLAPLPDTVQGQLNKGIKYGFDGIIVYADQVN